MKSDFWIGDESELEQTSTACFKKYWNPLQIRKPVSYLTAGSL